MGQYYNQKELDSVKEYFIKREMFYQLAILASIVFAFLLGTISF